MTMRRFLVLVILGVLGAACGQTAESPVTEPATTVPTTLATTTTATTPPPPTTTTVPSVDWGPIIATWEVSLRSVGPYDIGMALEDAVEAGGAELFAVEGSDPSCSYYTHDSSTGLDRELRFMVRAGRVVRIEIVGPQIKTLSGLGNGDTKAALVSAYGNGVIVSPSLFGEPNQEYVTYIPFDDSDSDYRIRFETTDDVVTSYRTGQLPEVEWFDRCE